MRQLSNFRQKEQLKRNFISNYSLLFSFGFFNCDFIRNLFFDVHRLKLFFHFLNVFHFLSWTLFFHFMRVELLWSRIWLIWPVFNDLRWNKLRLKSCKIRQTKLMMSRNLKRSWLRVLIGIEATKSYDISQISNRYHVLLNHWSRLYEIWIFETTTRFIRFVLYLFWRRWQLSTFW